MPIDDTTSLGPFADHIGLRLDSATGDRVVASWQARPDLHQPFGIVHGGVHCAVVETLASIGAGLWWGDRGQVVGVNNSTDFFRATSEGDMTSIATPAHRGRSTQVWDVETTDHEGRLVARGSVRLQNLQQRDRAAQPG